MRWIKNVATSGLRRCLSNLQLNVQHCSDADKDADNDYYDYNAVNDDDDDDDKADRGPGAFVHG